MKKYTATIMHTRQSFTQKVEISFNIHSDIKGLYFLYILLSLCLKLYILSDFWVSLSSGFHKRVPN